MRSFSTVFGLTVTLALGDDCCSCITGGGGMACASRCTSQSSACQTCVSNGGGSGCINDGRCSCSSPSPSPSPSPSGGDCRVYTSGTPGSREKYLVDQAKSNGKTGVELAQLLGQCAHECDSYNTMTEYASGAEYEGRCSDLGNCQTGDGVRYKGRGYIQITGRYNYRTYGGYIGQDLEGNPTLAEQPSIAAQVALQYWNRVVKTRVSNFADTTAVTKLINGGTNGLADRQTKFAQYKSACGVSLSFNEASDDTDLIDFPFEEENPTCSGPGEFCCPAPSDDVTNCPDSARTSTCDAQKSCCCGFDSGFTGSSVGLLSEVVV